jgi:hypothetical protein
MGSGLIRAADRHSHRICLRCHLIDAAILNTRCTPEPIFERDWKGFDQFCGNDNSHDVHVVTADTVTETWRKATILAVGEAGYVDDDDDDYEPSPRFEVSQRVFVRFDVGRSIPPGQVNSPFRVVYADAIPFVVEEE